MSEPLRIAYLTSFSPDLYESTGKDMLASYAKIGSPHRMLVYPEGLPGLESRGNIEVEALDGDTLLAEWLAQNRDIVPDYLGGDAKECKCPRRAERHGPHKPRCHWGWMARNTFRWLRKVACWRRVAMREDVDVAVWIDSDCRFLRPIAHRDLVALFGNTSVFYFRSHRPAIESGILGFDFRREGRRFINAICQRYLSGEFKKYERWDDGYIVTTVVNDRVVSTRDVCPPVTYWPGSRRLDNHVMRYTDVWDYIRHYKGAHGDGSKDLGNKGGVMR